MIVEIKPLPVKKWHGKKDKESFAMPKVVEALYDVELGGLATGLTPELEEKYTKLTGFDLSNRFDAETSHPFWSTKTAWLYLPNHSLRLDDTRPMEFLKIRLAKASKYVANSMKEYNEGLYPDATHVIHDEREEVETKATLYQARAAAMQGLSKLTLESKIDVIHIISDVVLRNNTQDYVDAALSDLIENSPEKIVATLALGKEDVTLKALVKELITRNILTKQGGNLVYMGEFIAYDEEHALTYFKDPMNAAIRIKLTEKLK